MPRSIRRYFETLSYDALEFQLEIEDTLLALTDRPLRSSFGSWGMPMKKLVLAVILSVAIAAPASALTAQQQRMKDCNSQASGMTGDAASSL
jgi:hypothetical protein